MSNTVKVGYALQEESIPKIEALCKITHRSKSSLIDWLVADKYAELIMKDVPCPEKCEVKND